jgi:hypothetical protein
MTALLALVAAALARIRSLPHGRERELGAALVAGGVAWLVHGVYDWDWDIPGVTMPALLLLGVAAGAPRPRLGTTPGWSLRRALGRAGESPVVRPALQGAVALLLCAFIVSAVLPAWSHSKALDALRLGDRPSPERLQDAAAQAQLASRLNPLAVEPLFSASTIAQRRGDALAARRYLLEAGHRQPDNRLVWFRLATLAVAMNDAPGFFRAANRALALDPASGVIRVLTQRAQGFITPPNESATATGTPLPSVAGPPSAPPAGG